MCARARESAPTHPGMIVIFNPAAGRRRASALWRVLDLLSASGVRLELAETQHAGHATALAREAAAGGARLVVAAGGDGTIAEVANGLAGSSAHLGVIPLGTANVLAHELGLPFTAHAVAAALAFGRTSTLWPGIATGPGMERLFVQMLGVGLDAQVVHSLNLPLKTRDRQRRVCRADGAGIDPLPLSAVAGPAGWRGGGGGERHCQQGAAVCRPLHARAVRGCDQARVHRGPVRP